jgi:hypothetical protein
VFSVERPAARRAAATPATLLRARSERGSLLVTAAITSAVIGILIGGMLTFISTEYEFEVRGHRWNQALNLAEAGVELAFAEFNNYYLTGQGGFASTRGWTYEGSGRYERYIPNYYSATGERIGYIYSYVNGVGTANPYLFAYGGCTTIPDGPVVYRAVEARLTTNSRFPAAMVAKRKIDLSANNCYVDSYDSTDPAKSTGFQYDAAKKQPHGDVASNDTITNTVDITIGNADIYGQALVGPNGGVTFGSGGSVGETFTVALRADTVEEALGSGFLRKDFQVDIPDARAPTGAATWPSLGTVNVATTITGGDYKLDAINMSGSDGKILTITGDVRLYVTGIIDLTGNASIKISSNSSLRVYAAGASARVTGNGVVNQALTPIKCQFYGLPTCTSFELSGNGQWVGTVYAPQAAMTMNGGGSAGDMSGAIVADTIRLNGGTQFHYDESLARNGPNSSFDINSWKSYRWTGDQWVSD